VSALYPGATVVPLPDNIGRVANTCGTQSAGATFG
jgi:hypothetical protein